MPNADVVALGMNATELESSFRVVPSTFMTPNAVDVPPGMLATPDASTVTPLMRTSVTVPPPPPDATKSCPLAFT